MKRFSRSNTITLILSTIIILGSNLILFPFVSLSFGEDDYTFKDEIITDCMETLVPDPRGFYIKHSTSFAAFRLNRNARDGSFTDSMNNGHWGDANNWDDNAQTLGIPVNQIPEVGAIAHWSAAEWNNNRGHVAYVESINSDGSVNIEEYNYSPCAYGIRGNIVPDRYIHIHCSIQNCNLNWYPTKDENPYYITKEPDTSIYIPLSIEEFTGIVIDESEIFTSDQKIVANLAAASLYQLVKILPSPALSRYLISDNGADLLRLTLIAVKDTIEDKKISKADFLDILQLLAGQAIDDLFKDAEYKDTRVWLHHFVTSFDIYFALFQGDIQGMMIDAAGLWWDLAEDLIDLTPVIINDANLLLKRSLDLDWKCGWYFCVNEAQQRVERERELQALKGILNCNSISSCDAKQAAIYRFYYVYEGFEKFDEILSYLQDIEQNIPPSLELSDLHNGAAWYYKYVSALYYLGIINGYPDGTFKPEQTINRVEFIKMVIEALRRTSVGPLPGGTPPASADQNAWYYDYLVQAYGCKNPNNNYEPIAFWGHEGPPGEDPWAQAVTREEASHMLMNALKLEPYNYPVSGVLYSDIDDTSPYKMWVYALYFGKIMEGYPDNSFEPEHTLNRAEACKIIHMMLRRQNFFE